MERKQFAKDLEKRTRKFAVQIHIYRQEKITTYLTLGILDHFRHLFDQLQWSYEI